MGGIFRSGCIHFPLKKTSILLERDKEIKESHQPGKIFYTFPIFLFFLNLNKNQISPR